MVGHLFDGAPHPAEGTEAFDTLLAASLVPGGTVRLERIVSNGVRSGEWYEQGWDEWVMVARGEATLEWGDGSTTALRAGDHLRIEAHRRHRVACTSADCVWLALHLGGGAEK